jgi:hypothetical protein
MKKTSRPLRLEPVEDRLVPSLTVLPDTRFDYRGSAAVRSDPGPPTDRNDDHGSSIDRSPGLRVAELLVTGRMGRESWSWTVVLVWSSDRVENPKSSQTGPRTKTPAAVEPDRPSAEAVREPSYEPAATPTGTVPVSTGPVTAPTGPATPPQPAAETPAVVAVSNAASLVRLVPSTAGPAGSNPGDVAGRQASNSTGPLRDPQEVRSEPPTVRPANASAIQVTDDSALTAAGVPVPAGTVPEPIPIPRPVEAVERVLDAVFPDGIPFLGAVTVDPTPASAASLLARIGSLADAAPDDGVTAERWVWLTAGAMAAAGGYAAARTGRRRYTPAPGAGSELARWENRHDDGSP